MSGVKCRRLVGVIKISPKALFLKSSFALYRAVKISQKSTRKVLILHRQHSAAY